jgi:hypothetical protein
MLAVGTVAIKLTDRKDLVVRVFPRSHRHHRDRAVRPHASLARCRNRNRRGSAAAAALAPDVLVAWRSVDVEYLWLAQTRSGRVIEMTLQPGLYRTHAAKRPRRTTSVITCA